MPAARPARPARLVALALAWGLAAALGLAGSAGTARADCQPDAPLDGDPVTCSAADADGFDAGAANDLTVTVEGAATVDDGVADMNAITVNDATTVIIETGGQVTADGNGSNGIQLGNGNEDPDGVFNSGSITTTGDNAGGILGGTDNDVTNSGAITAGTLSPSTGAFGVRLGDRADVTNETGAAILVIGNDVHGIEVGADSMVTNEGSLTVGNVGATTGGVVGIDTGDNSVVTNGVAGTLFGVVSVGGEDAIGVRMGADATLTNDGRITANGGDLGAVGLIAGSNSNIETHQLSVIEAGGNDDDAGGETVIGAQVGSGGTITNEGRISGDGTGAVGLLLVGGGSTTIANEATGVIRGDVDMGAAIVGTSGVEILTNRGRIDGDVDLGLGNDQVTLFTGAITNGDLIGGGGTNTLLLDGDGTGNGRGFLDLDTVFDFDSIEIDAMVTDPDTLEVTFGEWQLGGAFGGAGIALPGGLNLANGTLRLATDVTVDSAAGFVMGAGTTLDIVSDPINGTTGGLLILGGGNLDLSAADNTLTFSQAAPLQTSTTITVLETSAGALLGGFENVPMDTALLDFEVTEFADRVELDITRLSYSNVADTSNQQAIGQYLDGVLAAGGNSAGVDLLLVILDGLDATQLRRAYDGLSPEAYDAHTSQVAALGRSFAEAAIEPRLDCKPAFFGLDPGPLRDVPCGRSGFTAWMKLLFSEWDRDDDGEQFDSDGSRRGIAGGFDWRANRNVTATGYIGIAQIDIDVNDVGTGNVTSYEIGAAVQARYGGARINATFGYGRGQHEQDREIHLGVSNAFTDGKYDSNRIQTLLEVGWLFEYGNFQLEPLARLDVIWVQQEEINEEDVSGIQLNVDARDDTLVGTEFGGRLRYRKYVSAYSDDVIPYTQGTWTPEVSASWRSLWEGGDRTIDAHLGGAGGSFTVDAEDSKQGVDVGAALTFQPHGSGGAFKLWYDGFFGDRGTDNRFGANVAIHF